MDHRTLYLLKNRVRSTLPLKKRLHSKVSLYQSFSQHSFQPLSFLLPDEREEFLRRKDEHEVWLLKEDRIDRGKGIHIFHRDDDIPHCPSFDTDDPVLVQRYITRPMLIDGKKFHLRSVVLVSARRGVWMYDTIFLYRCGVAYDDDLSNRAAHLSNLHIAQHALEEADADDTLSAPSPAPSISEASEDSASAHASQEAPPASPPRASPTATLAATSLSPTPPVVPPPPPPPPRPASSFTAGSSSSGVAQFIPGAPIALAEAEDESVSQWRDHAIAKMHEIVLTTTLACPGVTFDHSDDYVVLAYDWMLECPENGQEAPSVILLEVNGTPGNLIGRRLDMQDMVEEIGHLMIDVRLRHVERSLFGFKELHPEDAS